MVALDVCVVSVCFYCYGFGCYCSCALAPAPVFADPVADVVVSAQACSEAVD